MGPALTVGAVVAKIKPAAPLLLITQRQTHKGVERIPVLVFGERDIAQHIGLVVDLAMCPQGAAPITVHRDREVLTTALHPLATGLATGVMDVSAQSFMGAHGELQQAETVFAMVPQSA